MAGPLPLALVIVAVLALIVLTHLMDFDRHAALVDADEAIALAQALPGGFMALSTIVAVDRRGALLQDAAGRIALIAGKGSRFVVRLAQPGWTARPFGEGALAIATPEFTVELHLGPDADVWADRLHHFQPEGV